jgi:hypothetical protein
MGMGFSVRFGAIKKAAPNRLHRRSLMAAASATTVLPGSRLVGLVGEAPSARLDEENPPELLQASCGLTTPPSRKMAAGRYRGSPVVESRPE